MSRQSEYFSTFKKAVHLLLCSVLIPALLLIALIPSCSNAEKTKIRVLCAGSLMVPFQAIERAYEMEYPEIDVLVEGHGSIQVIRHVTELHEESDLIAVADHSLIPMMMYNSKLPETDETYADWYIKFATNTLGIAYTPASKYADEINENNWYQILAKPDIKLGIADARLDSCGYRALMILYLAGSYYNDGSIFKRVLGDFNPAVDMSADGSVTTITVPEIMRPDNERIVVRGSSIRLLALLESGDIDYSFEYHSVAEQHNLNFLSLPPEINLGFVEQSDYYSSVRCKMDFQRFASVQPEFIGEPIFYGLTIPRHAPHYDEAVRFVEFMLGNEGQQILNQNYQPPLSPLEADNIDKVPEEIKALLK